MKLVIVGMTFRGSAFSCPFCLVNSQQNWHQTVDTQKGQYVVVDGLFTSICLSCQKRTVWFQEQLNLIVDDLFAREKRLETAYAKLPHEIHEQIEQRDKQGRGK